MAISNPIEIPPPIVEPTKFSVKKPLYPEVRDGESNKVVWENNLINLDRVKYVKFGSDNTGNLDIKYYIEFIFLDGYSVRWLCENESNMWIELSVLIRCDNPCDCNGGNPPH